MRFQSRFAVLCLAALSLSGPVHAIQQITYVAPCGDDTWGGGGPNCGSVPLFRPKRTIQAAINSSTLADAVVIVLPGTYHEAINFMGRSVTVRSANGPAVTTIDAAGLNSSVVRCVNGETSASVLEGFTVRGGEASLYAGMHIGGGIQIVDSSPTIRDCIFTNNHANLHGAGVAVYRNSSPRFLRCTIRNNQTGNTGAGVALFGTRTVLSHCAIEKNIAGPATGGIMVFDFEGTPADISIINCLIAGNSAVSQAGGVFVDTVSRVRLLGCTLANNTAFAGPGVYVAGDHCSITNCVVWGQAPTQVGGPGAATIAYSDVRGGATGPGNLNVDPMFVNPGGGDYHLQPTSPCIDAGDSTCLPSSIDLDGHSRPVDAPSSVDTGAFAVDPVIDMGAYESSPPACPGDISHDGLVNGIDLGQLLASWGVCP